MAESLKEFIKLNRKDKVLKMKDQIQRMFGLCQFGEIIEQVEEFAETHKLVWPPSIHFTRILVNLNFFCFEKSLADTNFDPLIYIHLLRSYFNLNQLDKCIYFSRKFLKQVIVHLNARLAAFNADKSENLIKVSSDSENSNSMSNGATSKNIPQIFAFITTLLDIILE